MPAIRRILCPLDFSRFSRHALDQAVALARELGAEITAFHVFAPAPLTAVLPAGTPVLLDAVHLSPAQRAALIAEVRDFTYEVDADGVVVHVDVLEGDAVDTILNRAGEWPADLIVMGTHGRTGVQRLLLGSVAERVIRRAPCAVLTVPARVLSPTRALSLGRLLCPVDFSPASLHALEYAAAFAAPCGPGVCAVHVVELFAGTKDTIALDTPDYRADVVSAARVQLEGFIPAAVRARCPVTEVVTAGHAGDAIVRVAAEQDCDAIVIGVGARGAADLLLFGSTTQTVVRHAGCPVLTVRA
jgi:nucleotide-binding universal stress UspA family protein